MADKMNPKLVVDKKKKKPTHPPTSEMVTTAIKVLNERGGSSLHAIRKFIKTNYEVNIDRITPFIKVFLKKAVESGILVRKRGTGATGSFKLSPVLRQRLNSLKNGKQMTQVAGSSKQTVTAKKASKQKPSETIDLVEDEPATEEIVVKVEPILMEEEDTEEETSDDE